MTLTRNGLRAFYVECDQGCGIRWYRSLRNAVKSFRSEAGTYSNAKVRRATEEDMAWVGFMGGRTGQ